MFPATKQEWGRDMAEADRQDAIETQDTQGRNIIGILGVYVLMGVFLYFFFSAFRMD